jgi:hypothetical protein
MENQGQKHNGEYILSERSAFVGFDGYVDEIVMPMTAYGRFESIKQFNEFIIKHESASADISVKRVYRRMGGNAPILAHSLAKKGLTLHCAGAIGEGSVLSVFEQLQRSCETTAISAPAECYALEFPDGKIMFGERSTLDDITPRLVKQRIGERKLNELLESDLICFVNWGGLNHGNDIIKEILLGDTQKRKEKMQILFMDLADISTAPLNRVSELISLMPRLKQRYYTMLSANRKEAVNLAEYIGEKAESISQTAQTLLMRLEIDEITVHSLGCSVAVTKENEASVIPETVKQPKVVTGAGDNYNAGYCIGKLLGKSLEECVKMGNASAYSYVRNGEPCGLEQLLIS